MRRVPRNRPGASYRRTPAAFCAVAACGFLSLAPSAAAAPDPGSTVSTGSTVSEPGGPSAAGQPAGDAARDAAGGAAEGAAGSADLAVSGTVRVSLLPSGTKMLLSVWSDSGPGTAMDQLITDFDVTGITGQPALPATLKVGFSASTGGATNIHEIDDLQINVPADLTIAKTGSPASVPAGGGPVTYTLAVSNSQANEVTGAVVRDTVPGLTNVT